MSLETVVLCGLKLLCYDATLDYTASRLYYSLLLDYWFLAVYFNENIQYEAVLFSIWQE